MISSNKTTRSLRISLMPQRAKYLEAVIELVGAENQIPWCLTSVATDYLMCMNNKLAESVTALFQWIHE